ncbi:MAG: peroxiredoxin [Neisseriaceae bacterium]|nr:peroxiredoxin [Neisseriaceae bacterium]MBP6861108.1 peroxiredoxin [Neisseriaceae bacterium]
MTQKISFTLPATDNVQFNSDEHLPLVVYFYPKDSTPGCTTEANDFKDHLAEFEALGYTVVGISRDSIKSHENFKAKQGLNFALLSDAEETVCTQFDVIKMKNMYGKQVMGIERSTFILNPEGEISKEWRKVRVPDHVAEVLAYLKEAAKQA